MTVSENIRRIRKEKGLTQKQLGELCRINEANVRKYELGKANPKIETLKKIAAALDCQISDIDENIIVIPKYELTPERLEKIKKDAEAEEIIQRYKAGEEITKEEQQKVSDYSKRIIDGFYTKSDEPLQK